MGEENIWSIFGAILVPALLGFIIGVQVRLFAIRHDELNSRINDICSGIDYLSEKAAAYWILPGKTPDLAIKEAEIVGLQHRIIAMVEMIGESHWNIERQVEDYLFSFNDLVSGGEFQVKGRSPDIDRAAKIHRAASVLIVELRKARRSMLRSIF